MEKIRTARFTVAILLFTGLGLVADAQTSGGADQKNSQRDGQNREQVSPDHAVTPGDQGENRADLNITKRIRQAVMENKALSFSAHNVKIITLRGRVSLRGEVETDAEKQAIESIAAGVVSASSVDSQLEVKPNK